MKFRPKAGRGKGGGIGWLTPQAANLAPKHHTKLHVLVRHVAFYISSTRLSLMQLTVSENKEQIYPN